MTFNEKENSQEYASSETAFIERSLYAETCKDQNNKPKKKTKKKALEPRELVLRKLGVRDHTEFEIREYLKKKSISRAEIDSIIEEFKEGRYLDDDRAANTYAWELHRKYYGIYGVMARFRKKGLPTSRSEIESIIVTRATQDTFLGGVEDEQNLSYSKLEAQTAKELFQRKINPQRFLEETSGPLNSQDQSARETLRKQKDKAIRHLVSRGFSESAISAALSE